MSAIGKEMDAFEEMAAEWQRRLRVITAMLLASESESERRILPLFTDSSLLQPQADTAGTSTEGRERFTSLSSAY